MKVFILFLGFLLTQMASAKVVNVYVWGGEIPKEVVQQFERETGIKVNFSTFDSNETMYSKLRASRKMIYDVIMPSAYYVERMQKFNLLHPLNHKKLPNLKYLEPTFVNNNFDPGNRFSVPFIWGATGIFYNTQHVKIPVDSWQALWKNSFRKQLLLLDDPREIFSIALISLGYGPNDTNPEHIKQAYEHLLELVPNIKLFASESVQAIMIDEDASIGTSWNGDAYKAKRENPSIRFSFPKEGFVIWVDCLAIPNGAPHLEEAYQFINFMLRPEIATLVAIKEGHAITNLAGKNLLPMSIKNDKIVYPELGVIKNGHFQRDIGDEIITLYNHYWEQLKLAF